MLIDPARVAELSDDELIETWHNWGLWGRDAQLPPPGDWVTWLLLGGRGAGKTRAGAEWVRRLATEGIGPIALVGETITEAIAVMVLGASGLMAVTPPGERPQLSGSTLRWPNGVVGTILIHVVIILLGKYIKVMPTPPLKLADGDVTVKEQELNFTLSPDEPRLPPEFVEVNPDAPEAEPEKTNQTGAKNQKVAQPDPGKDDTEKPKTEGELKQSSAIVTGQRAQPVNTPPPAYKCEGFC